MFLTVTEHEGGGISPGENFVGKISPLRKVAKFPPGELFGGTVPSSATAAGIVYSKKSQAPLLTRLSPGGGDSAGPRTPTTPPPPP